MHPAARNVPTDKRSTAVGIVTAASYAGTALAFGLSPFLITRMGWQYVFYLFGGAALIWLPLWLPLNVYSQLPDHGSGSGSSRSGKEAPEDVAARQQLLPASGATGAPGSSSSSSTTGFKALLRRREVWAICVCQYTQSYGLYSMLAWLPAWFNEFWGVEVGDLSSYTLLPYAAQVCLSGWGIRVWGGGWLQPWGCVWQVSCSQMQWLLTWRPASSRCTSARLRARPGSLLNTQPCLGQCWADVHACSRPGLLCQLPSNCKVHALLCTHMHTGL